MANVQQGLRAHLEVMVTPSPALSCMPRNRGRFLPSFLLPQMTTKFSGEGDPRHSFIAGGEVSHMSQGASHGPRVHSAARPHQHCAPPALRKSQSRFGGSSLEIQALGGEARCTTRLWVFGSLASDWLLALPLQLQRPHIRLSTVQRNAYSMPCRANRFEPMGMTSEMLGAMLPIPPRDPSPM
jgi:hypothetical protein